MKRPNHLAAVLLAAALPMAVPARAQQPDLHPYEHHKRMANSADWMAQNATDPQFWRQQRRMHERNADRTLRNALRNSSRRGSADLHQHEHHKRMANSADWMAQNATDSQFWQQQRRMHERNADRALRNALRNSSRRGSADLHQHEHHKQMANSADWMAQNATDPQFWRQQRRMHERNADEALKRVLLTIDR